jgi:glycosyltransferase involved in cell wall biosynthesis
MRLTVLSVSYPLARLSPSTAGGAEQLLATIDRALIREGHRSLVLAPQGSRTSGLLIPAQIPSGVLDQAAKAQAQGTFKELLEHTLALYSIDVVHMHGLDFSEYMPGGDVPVVVSLHLPLSWYQSLALSRPNTTLVGVSKHQARTAPAGCHIDWIVPNGVELGRYHPAPRAGNYALLMGRVCPEKGLHLAIDAAERAGIQLIIAGTIFDYPEHRSYFESMIRPRLGGAARFIASVGGFRKRQLLAGAKCLLIPSLVHETSSLIAMEAMAAGTPVIAWHSGALPEIVAEGRTGFVVASVREMAEAIGRVHEIQRAQCRRQAERRFDAKKMVAQYIDLYQQVATQSLIPEFEAA